MNQHPLDELLAKFNGGKLRGAARRFAQKLKVGEGTVSRWRNGDSPPDEGELRARAARSLNVTVEELMSAYEQQAQSKFGGGGILRDISTPYPAETGYQFLNIPHLGIVRADRFSFSFDVPPENFTTLAIKGKAGDRYAMLRISGDCMSPRIEDGDEVLVRQTSEVADGSIAIVCYDSECTMKRIYRKKDGVQLKADNPDYPPRTIASSKVRVMAEVVKIIKDPRKKP